MKIYIRIVGLLLLFACFGTVLAKNVDVLTPEERERFEKERREWQRKPVMPEPLYFLPYPQGETHMSAQGWFGESTHADYQNFHAYDFQMKEGETIVAARGGVMTEKSVTDGSKGGNMENHVVIDHGDGSRATYAHIKSGTCPFEPGDEIQVGEKIAECSNEAKHLHFAVWDDDWTVGSIPFSFYDVPGGYCVDMKNYKSGNPGPNGTPMVKFGKLNAKPKQRNLKQAKAYMERAVTADKEGNVADAVKYYQLAIDRGIEGEEAKSAQTRVDEMTVDARKELEAAKVLIDEEKFDEAIAKLTEVKKGFTGTDIEKEAASLVRKIKTSEAWAALDDDDEAKELWDKAEKFREEGNPYQARHFYQKIMFDFPDSKYADRAYDAMNALED